MVVLRKGKYMLTGTPEVDKLLTELSSYNYKKLEKGEKVLLAKAISDTIPLPKEINDDFSMYMLQYKVAVTMVLDAISHYLYLDDKEAMFQLVKDFTYWRYMIAFEPPHVVFNSSPDNLVDDLSCLNKYVDIGAICAVADIYNNASHLYRVFRTISAYMVKR